MKILVTGNQKGGVGKTTITLHLAWVAALLYGKKVVVLDLDTQGNTSATLSEHCSPVVLASDFLREKEASLPQALEKAGITVVQSDLKLADCETGNFTEIFQNLKGNLSRLSQVGFDLCLIDTPPSLGVAMSASISAADFLISPIKMDHYSIQGFKKLNDLIGNLKKHTGSSVKFLGLVLSMFDRRNPLQKGIKAQFEKENPNIIFKSPIGQRSSIEYCALMKKPVWKFTQESSSARRAGKEMKEFAAELFGKMGIEK